MVAGMRLGVDLGTSNTVAVLRWPDGRCRPLLFDGSPLLPSAVYAGPDGMLVGRDAVSNARVHPDRFERNPKRRIDDGTVLLGDVELPVVDLLAAVLRQVNTEAVRVAGGPVPDVVLTHPVGWGPRRRAMLAHAAGRAGLGTPRLVPEPVAAASYFVAVLHGELPVGRSLVVYDFGAGTFDATVVRRIADSLEVLATDGVADAGGLDIDAAVVAYLGEVLAGRDETAWQRLVNPRTSADRRLSQQLWDDVRGAKEMLSRAPSTVLHVPLLDADAPVGREQLERFARPVLDRTIEATRAALAAAGVPADAVGGVFLVGGSSRIPLVATLLHRALRVAPTTLEQPEIVVAEGSLFAPPGTLAAADLRAYAPPPPGRRLMPARPATGPPPRHAPPAAARPVNTRPVRAVAPVVSARATVPARPAPAPTPPPAPSPPPATAPRRELPVRPVVVTLAAGAGYTLADGPQLLTAGGSLLLFRGADRLSAFLGRRSFAGVAGADRWAALPGDLRADELAPAPDDRYDYPRLGRILAAACPPGSLPMHRTAAGRFVPVQQDRAAQADPAEVERHVEFVRRVFAALGRQSGLLSPERIERSTGPVVAAAATAGRLDAGSLDSAAPQERFRAASWWWQLVDEFGVAVAWR